MNTSPSSRKLRIMIVGAIVATNCITTGLTLAQPSENIEPPNISEWNHADPNAPQILRVYFKNEHELQRLANSGLDLIEYRETDHVFVMGDANLLTMLQQQGYKVETDQILSPLPPIHSLSKDISPNRLETAETYASGYRTVVEHYQHLDTVAANFPTLVSVFDYGDSWRKTNNLANGHDLKAICITKKQAGDCALTPNSNKPRFLLMAAIHARELSTSEMAYRWIDYLLNNYNNNADVAMLLDHNEMWVIPVVNPDGRLIVEGGGNTPYLQRKNANNTSGTCAVPPTSTNQHGVDLNRNANWGWAPGALGTSTNPCDQTYNGPSASSEPEIVGLQTLVGQLFPDTKGPAITDPAAQNTRGAFITLHSYGNLVLLPFGDNNGNTPNDAGLRALAFRMSSYNNYKTGRPPEILYGVTGATDDWAYGTLGVPSFTFEMGANSGTCSGFTPAYTCQDSTFWPLNLPAFLFAAKNVREPYNTALGPVAINLNVSASNVVSGNSISLTATLNDNAFGNAAGSIGRPTSQPISTAQYFLDTPPWAGGVGITMNASDGTFNTNNENVTVSINSSGLALGRHTLYVRGKDTAGNWGAPSAIFFNVVTQTLSGNSGLLNPSTNNPKVSNSGDNNGYENSPTNAYTNDGIFAVDRNSGTSSTAANTTCTSTAKDSHQFGNYNISVPNGTNIAGIEVRLDAKIDSITPASFICAQLSWDGGTTWTAIKTTPSLTTAEATYTLGSATDTWGRAWNLSELSNTNFKLRLIDVAGSTARDFSLDWAAIRVHYQ